MEVMGHITDAGFKRVDSAVLRAIPSISVVDLKKPSLQNRRASCLDAEDNKQALIRRMFHCGANLVA